jgi:hypothetical protein
VQKIVVCEGKEKKGRLGGGRGFFLKWAPLGDPSGDRSCVPSLSHTTLRYYGNSPIFVEI